MVMATMSCCILPRLGNAMVFSAFSAEYRLAARMRRSATSGPAS